MKNDFLGRAYLLILLISLLLVSGCIQLDRPPSARYGAQMVYDPAKEQMILFGGRGDGLLGEKSHNDTWIFDLGSESWGEMKTINPPSERLSPGLVFDPVNRQLILFGGMRNNTRFGDTWILDIESGRWEEIFSVESPFPRSDMAIAIDPINRIVLLSGGYCREDQREMCADTWIFTLDDRQWVKRYPESSPPLAYGSQMVFDPGSRQFLLWGGHMTAVEGGINNSLGYGDTLWEYTYQENQWQIIKSVGTPPERYWHTMVAANENTLVLFGGNGGRKFLGDTWIYETGSKKWDRSPSGEGPSPCVNPSAAFDTQGNRVILFGGLDNDSKPLRSTWEYALSSGEWTQIIP